MSDLLNQASLVMVPSGYKEDTVYSVVPSDGSGDMAFTRASNGTRVNSAGLVEVCPWNLLENTNTFSSWNLEGGALTSGFTAPDGTSTAYKYVQVPGNGLYSGNGGVTADVKFAQVWIKSVSGGSMTCNISDGTSFFGTLNVTGTWQLFTAPFTANTRIGLYLYAISNASGIYVWHPQLNIGSTAKPYFPTTDRLNVPRLTYQNGGGGCPSLLLEKQSTNILTYSEDFSNAAWSKLDSGSGSTTPVVTANYAISPDGTQNADRLQCTLGSSGYSLIQQSPTLSGTHTGSVWVKSNTSANQNIYFRISQNTTAYVVTPEWQRINITEVNGDYLSIGLRDQTGYTNYSCDILIWGAQLEASSYATSLINTTSSSATRVADACFKTGISSLIGQGAGTLFFDFIRNTNETSEDFWLSDSGPSTNDVIYWRNADKAVVVYSGSTQASLSFSSISFGRYKMAIGYANNDFVLYANGALIASDTSGTAPTNLSFLGLSAEQQSTISPVGGSNPVNQVALFKTRLTNAELASLTTI